MKDQTVSESLAKAVESMSFVMSNIQLARKLLACYLLDNINVLSSMDSKTPTSPYSQISTPTTASSLNEPPSHCQGLQSAIMQFQSAGIDEVRIFVIRKVHGLVSDATEILFEYFSRYGKVTHVELLPSRRRCGRLRPSTTGFIILEDSVAVARVLSDSPVHRVTSDHVVEVTPFTYPMLKSSCPFS